MSSQFGVPAANCNLVRRWSQQGVRRGEESMEEKLRKGGQTIYEKNGMNRTQNTTYLHGLKYAIVITIAHLIV